MGLVLITGQNGAGKSTFLEVVSYAGWGKTLRGTDPRRAGVAGQASIETGFGMQVTRRWGDGMRNAIDVALKGEPDWVFDTAAKAQDHVTNVLGEWDTWRRSCAFSSVDDLSFATATDSERKRLLESLIGLARFDRALDACRVDLKAATMISLTHRATVNKVQTTYAEATRNLVALEAMCANAAPTADLKSITARLDVVKSMLPTREANYQSERTAHRASSVGTMEHEASIRRLEAQIRELAGSMNCPTCRQDWPDKNERDKRRVGLEHDLATLKAEPPPKADEQRLKAAEEALRDCKVAISTIQAELTAADKEMRAFAEAQALVKQAKLNILDMEDAETMAAADLADAERTHRHLEVTDTVLGTKGARAHMLTDALAGLEAVANLWLERIARTDAPLKLRLSPYTEKKSGGTADAISMEVEGAGGGRGYRAASGGERRRIDVAIMLALGEVAARADNRVSPTMFFDEVFDSLDVPGVEAVASALDQLAQDRCVVVMSHSTDLIMNLVPDLRIHVQDGKIEHR